MHWRKPVPREQRRVAQAAKRLAEIDRTGRTRDDAGASNDGYGRRKLHANVVGEAHIDGHDRHSNRRFFVHRILDFVRASKRAMAIFRNEPRADPDAVPTNPSVNTPRQPGRYGLAQPVHICA